eukprot:97191-Amphidinium_carterae.3
MGKTTTLTRRFGKPEVGNPRRGSILDLQSSDFQLSRALSIQLGLAPDVPAAGEPRKSTSRRASQLLAKNRGVNIENCLPLSSHSTHSTHTQTHTHTRKVSPRDRR